MVSKGEQTPLISLSKQVVYKAIHRALRDWDLPTREGFDFFAGMLIPADNGFSSDLPIVEGRIALNSFIEGYVLELSKLQPMLATILILRFKDRVNGQAVAYRLGISLDQMNRIQRLAVNYLAGLIYDDELRRRKGARPRKVQLG